MPVPEDRNVLVVYCPADDHHAGAELAGQLDAALRPIVELNAEHRSGAAADIGGDALVLDRDVLEQVADLHRGETVVVVTVRDGGQPREVRIDADGWAVRVL